MWIRDHHERLLNTDHLIYIKVERQKSNGKETSQWVVAAASFDQKYLPYLTEGLDKDEAQIRLDLIRTSMENGKTYLELP